MRTSVWHINGNFRRGRAKSLRGRLALATLALGLLVPLDVANAERPAAEFSEDPSRQVLDQIMSMMEQERAASVALTADALANMGGLGVHRPVVEVPERGFSLFGISFGNHAEDTRANASVSSAQASSRAVDLATETGTTFNMAVLDSMPKASGGREWKCLTEALYFEARSETLAGQFAVGEVILNRVASPRFPDTVCGVVGQGASRRNACQFSYNCDGKAERFTEPLAYERSGKLARMLLDGRALALTHGATYYHASSVSPSWARSFEKTAEIGRHSFYRN